MIPAETLAHFEGRTPAIIEAIREIVEIESPSHHVERSRMVADWVESQFRSTDVELEIERIFAEGDGEHLIIRAFPGEAKPVVLVGHTDTVHPVGTKEKNPTRIDGDRFYGCGIFDMKANIVLMVEAFRFLNENNLTPARPITIFLSCDEEVGSHSGRAILEREAANAEMAYVFEPSAAGRIKTGRKGTGQYVVKTHGIPAHAGLEPEKGASAILELARQIERLQSMNDAVAGTTVNACTIRGGTTSNVIPEFAEAEVDVRFTSMSEAERIDREIKSLLPVDGRVKIVVEGGINRPPMERTDTVVSLYEKARSVAASFDYEIGETQVGGASDGNFIGALGIPVLDGLGITGDGAHTLHEHILVSDIANRAALVTLLLSA
jgi:glutamate carboxypeptidase